MRFREWPLSTGLDIQWCVHVLSSLFPSANNGVALCLCSVLWLKSMLCISMQKLTEQCLCTSSHCNTMKSYACLQKSQCILYYVKYQYKYAIITTKFRRIHKHRQFLQQIAQRMCCSNISPFVEDVRVCGRIGRRYECILADIYMAAFQLHTVHPTAHITVIRSVFHKP